MIEFSSFKLALKFFVMGATCRRIFYWKCLIHR